MVVNVLKHNFLGKTVLQYEGMQTGVQDVIQQKQLKAWKTQLLQVCVTLGSWCPWPQQTSAYLLLLVKISLLQNAYEDLSVELGYQILVDSDEE